MENSNRRSTRSALFDISRNIPMGSRTPTTGSTNVEIPDSFLTPSPDEQVITSRGRKKTQFNASDGDILKYLHMSSKTKTPTKNKSPGKSPLKRPTLPTRSSPRKRLHLEDSPAAEPVIDDNDLPSPPPFSPSPSKRSKNGNVVPKRGRSGCRAPDWRVSIEGLAHHQLVQMIAQLIDIHPTLIHDVEEHMPVPDIKELGCCLESLKKNIYKSMPYCRWGSDRDAFCYRRVQTHLVTFKSKCIGQGKQLLNSHQWTAAIEYVFMAWNCVTELPDWDNPAHNKPKQQCYKSLASQCMNALKKGKFTKEYYEEIEDKLNDAKSSSNEIEPCIGLVTKLMDKLLNK